MVGRILNVLLLLNGTVADKLQADGVDNTLCNDHFTVKCAAKFVAVKLCNEVITSSRFERL